MMAETEFSRAALHGESSLLAIMLSLSQARLARPGC
jgi:hypothetical protein